MDKLLFIVIVTITSLTANAQSNEAKKYIKKYDVIDIVKDLPKGNPLDFWNKVRANNKRVKELKEAQESNNKTLKETMWSLTVAVTDLSYADDIVEGYDSLKNRISTDIGMVNLFKKLPIRIIQSTEVNASMDPIGQMRINTESIKLFTYEELLAVCAHEAAHHVCAHVLSKAWKSEKKRKKNRLLAEIEAGILVGAAAATAGYGIANGVEMKSANMILANPDIFLHEAYSDADGATTRYKYRYSRDEEIEADIIAYRFMEYMGYGVEHWISAQKKVGAVINHTVASKYDSHPLPTIRLEILEAMRDGFSGKGTANKKIATLQDDLYK